MDVEPLMNVLERFYQEYSAPEIDYFREYGKGVFPIPKESGGDIIPETGTVSHEALSSAAALQRLLP